MKLSAQEEYGLRCLLQLAREGAGRSLTLSQLSHREGISVPHVAKLMRVLRRHGLVTSTRGQAGGYTLARAAGELTVGEVLGALGGRLFDPSFCERHTGVETLCTHMGDCSIRPVLRRLQDAFDHVLGQLSLQSLICTEKDVPLPAGREVTIPVSLLRRHA